MVTTSYRHESGGSQVTLPHHKCISSVVAVLNAVQNNNLSTLLPLLLSPVLCRTVPVQSVPKAVQKQPSPLLAGLSPDKLLAVELVKSLYFDWKGPMETLDKAGRAFQGLEALLGGSGFEVQGNIWRRQVRILEHPGF